MRMVEAVEAKTVAARWGVATTHLHAERLAKENLERQGFATYLPLMVQARTPTRTNPKPGNVIRPFLPGFIFVQLNPSVDRWRCLFSTRGLRSVMMAGEQPGLIADAELQKIRAREEGGLIKMMRAEDAPRSFKHGDPVTVNDHGPFHGFDGLFDQYLDKNRCVLLVRAFGRLVGVQCTPLAIK